MNSPAIFHTDSSEEETIRHWPAHLHLHIAKKGDKSVLLRTDHQGPLRVQRAFYPERDGCCHVYLLHPPGGLVIGDDLQIAVEVASGAQALLTTPSAGKFYGAKDHRQQQIQKVELQISDAASLEWLPQETIIFNSARARLHTKVNIFGKGKFFGWDIARLGRIASGENFDRGSCMQSLEVWHDGRPLFMEKNKFVAGSDLQRASWGLQARNTTGTLLATLELSRDNIDELYEKLESQYNEAGLWGLTQKNALFIARYLGDSITECRAGFELVWRETRKIYKGTAPVAPRIWNT